MILRLSGEIAGTPIVGRSKLSEVETTSYVYSKAQAQAEFERFLEATGLPELSPQEEKARDLQLQKEQEQ